MIVSKYTANVRATEILCFGVLVSGAFGVLFVGKDDWFTVV